MVLRTVGFQRGLQDSCCENGHFQCLLRNFPLCFSVRDVLMLNLQKCERGTARSSFSDVLPIGIGGACNSALNGPIDPKFCMWGTFDFCSSQGHMTSTEAKPIPASKCDWPLYRSYDLDLNRNQMHLPKDPHMQNFRSIGPLGAELQTPPVQ